MLITVKNEMKQRYRVFRRGWGTYYCEDQNTKKQETLRMVVSFERQKTGTIAIMRFDEATTDLLRSLPKAGAVFPHLRPVRASNRATEFKERCDGLGIKGVTLHSYRYAWAERAKKAGYPERFAAEALGHNSKTVHRAYARKARMELPALGDYERKIIRLEEMDKRASGPLQPSEPKALPYGT